jgi:hypothetical protein
MVKQQVTDAVTTSSPFPSETIDLPSNGVFYPEDSPLRSGQVEIKYMTAKEEDILTSPNLIQKGIVLDKLIDSLIVTTGVKAADLLVGDLNAVMVAARILGYGKDYEVTMDCPSCGKLVEQVVNLSELATTNSPEDGNVAEFKIILPISKAEIELKLLSRKDELDIEKELKALKKVNSDIEAEATTRLKAIIGSVNGDTSKATIWKFVDTLLVRDARYLREQYKNLIPDVDFDILVECDCGANQKGRLPIGPTFFWPDARV